MARHIFFDLDGTLTDPKIGITTCIQFALRKLNIDVLPMDELTWCIGPPLMQSLAKLVGQDRAPQALEIFRQRFSTAGWRENVLYPGIEETLGRLHEAGLSLCVATSKPKIFATRIVEHFRLGRYFDRIYGSELDGTRGDKSELLAYAIHHSGVYEIIAMVGDREHDIIGALANGVSAIGVTYGYGSREELVEAGAAIVVDSPAELTRVLL